MQCDDVIAHMLLCVIVLPIQMQQLAADAVCIIEVVQRGNELRAAFLACDEFVVQMSGAIDMHDLSRDLIPNRLGAIMDVHSAYRANHSSIIMSHRNHAPCILHQ